MNWQPISCAPTQGVILAYITGDGQNYMTTICRIDGKWYSNHSCRPFEFGEPVMWVALPRPPEVNDAHIGATPESSNSASMDESFERRPR